MVPWIKGRTYLPTKHWKATFASLLFAFQFLIIHKVKHHAWVLYYDDEGQEGRKDNEHILGFKVVGKVGEDVDANGLVGMGLRLWMDETTQWKCAICRRNFMPVYMCLVHVNKCRRSVPIGKLLHHTATLVDLHNHDISISVKTAWSWGLATTKKVRDGEGRASASKSKVELTSMFRHQHPVALSCQGGSA